MNNLNENKPIHNDTKFNFFTNNFIQDQIIKGYFEIYNIFLKSYFESIETYYFPFLTNDQIEEINLEITEISKYEEFSQDFLNDGNEEIKTNKKLNFIFHSVIKNRLFLFITHTNDIHDKIDQDVFHRLLQNKTPTVLKTYRDVIFQKFNTIPVLLQSTELKIQRSLEFIKTSLFLHPKSKEYFTEFLEGILNHLIIMKTSQPDDFDEIDRIIKEGKDPYTTDTLNEGKIHTYIKYLSPLTLYESLDDFLKKLQISISKVTQKTFNYIHVIKITENDIKEYNNGVYTKLIEDGDLIAKYFGSLKGNEEDSFEANIDNHEMTDHDDLDDEEDTPKKTEDINSLTLEELKTKYLDLEKMYNRQLLSIQILTQQLSKLKTELTFQKTGSIKSSLPPAPPPPPPGIPPKGDHSKMKSNKLLSVMFTTKNKTKFNSRFINRDQYNLDHKNLDSYSVKSIKYTPKI